MVSEVSPIFDSESLSTICRLVIKLLLFGPAIVYDIIFQDHETLIRCVSVCGCMCVRVCVDV